MKKLTEFWTNEAGDEYVTVPKDLWLEVLGAASDGTQVEVLGGGGCSAACRNHGGVAWEGGTACCCNDGSCFSV